MTQGVMLSFRVTEKEAEMIRGAAIEAGMTLSQWIRAQITGVK
jgi:uncharacterized protein (DUF1778 family)